MAKLKLIRISIICAVLTASAWGSAFAQTYPGNGTSTAANVSGDMDGGTAPTHGAGSSGAIRISNPQATDLGSKRTVTPGTGFGRVTPPQPQKLSEFQRFVLEATGKILPIYGQEFFTSETGVAPQQNGPVSADYPIGPGDELVIRGSGAIDIDYKAIVDRNGAVNIPRVGTVHLAGTRASEVEQTIRTAISKVFRGFTLNVSLGQLRGITVYVVGQARKPGTYNLSSVSTAISALFESGGPGANGSLRRVQIKRGGKIVSEIDLYAFLAKGDKSTDVRLVDGDVIVIPPAAGYVALTGKLETPAIYELHGRDDTVQSLLDVAGGLPVVADPRRAFLERVDQELSLPRSVEEFTLDAHGLKKPMKNGDLLSVIPITAEFSNAVTLQGSVHQALRVPFKQGMRVTDLIPSKEYLVSKASVKRRNQSLVFQEQQEAEGQRKLFPYEQAQLDSYSGKARPSDVPAEPGSLEKFDRSGRIDPIVGDERQDRSERNDIGVRKQMLADRIGNLYADINWDYAVVERPNRKELTESLIPFNLGRALSDPSSTDNLVLMPGDIVTVFSAEDVRVPIAKRRVYVRVEGEVRKPGVYKVEAGETLINIIERAGGLTGDAFLYGAEFYRESVRKAQQANLDKLVNRLEQQALSDSGRLAANASTTDPSVGQLLQARLAAESESRKQFLQRLRDLKSSGRITLGLAPKEASLAQIPEFRLENGDRLIVPNRPDFVQVFGAVSTESALLWQPGRSVVDYLAKAGLARDADKDATFVLRADGTVASNTDRWLSSVSGIEVLPGDIIVTPEKLDKESFWTAFARGAKDWTQIFSNLGLGAAAIRTLR